MHKLRLLGLLLISAVSAQSLAQTSWLEQQAYQLHARIVLEAVGEDASGLAFDPIRQRLWLVADNARLFELTSEGEVLRHIQLKGFDDPEGLTWLGGDAQHSRLALSEERRGQILAISVDTGSRVLNYEQANLLARFDKTASNNGIEGLAVNAQGQLFGVSERNPQAAYRINKIKGESPIKELWRVGWLDFFAEPMDYAGLTYVPQTNSLLIASDRSRDLREYDLAGNQLGKLSIDASDPEGVALAPDGTLYICSEPKQLLIYKPAHQLP